VSLEKLLNWSLIHRDNPYTDFPHESYDLSIHGWNFESSLFDRLINEVKPSLIIEVGTWLGGSALRMADLCKTLGLQAQIVCIDTWLGSVEFLERVEDPDRYALLRKKNGYPQVYPQFLANVIKSNSQDIIIPFPITSSIAGRFLMKRKILADMIYIDASHDYEDVIVDLRLYYNLLRSGGTFFGDDFVEWWPGVQKAVNEFTKEIGVEPQMQDNFWIIKKP
jgi:cephalosporin hydroxylase